MTLDPSIKETLEKTYNYLSEYFAKNVDIGASLMRQADNLLNVMARASFNPPTQGQTELADDYHSKLDSVIAAGWS